MHTQYLVTGYSLRSSAHSISAQWSTSACSSRAGSGRRRGCSYRTSAHVDRLDFSAIVSLHSACVFPLCGQGHVFGDEVDDFPGLIEAQYNSVSRRLVAF